MSRHPNGSTHGSPSTRKSRRQDSLRHVDAKVAVDLATAQTYSENVFLFIPNLIGEQVFLIPDRGPMQSDHLAKP